MEKLKRHMSGGHTPREIRNHLIMLVLVFTALVFCAYLSYPSKDNFSVTTEMLSALGSPDQGHNPEWFWVFSTAMVFCGIVLAPVALYIRRRFLPVSYWGAQIGACFFLLGCLGIASVGLFPYAHRDLVGPWQWQDFHMMAAGTVAAGFALGVLWHGMLVFRDRLTKRVLAVGNRFPYLKYAGPYLLCVPVFGLFFYNLRWERVFKAFGAIGTSWSEASDAFRASLSGFTGFPLLEHLAIWVLTAFVIWFTVILPHDSERDDQ